VLDKATMAEATPIAMAEAEAWQKIYCAEYGWQFSRLECLGTQIFLLMPYLRGLTVQEREIQVEAKDSGELWAALLFFINRGYKHNDLKWHHVGTFYDEKTGKRKIALMDLANVEGFVGSTEEKQTWVKDAFELLRGRLLLDPPHGRD
jgi:Family of unknown function (DUF5898)